MFWWRQCWRNQTIEAKATRSLQQLHIFVNAEGHEDVVCFRNVVEYTINKKLQSFKNSIEDKAGWVAQIVAKFIHDEIKKKKTANLFQPIEDISSIIDSNLRIFHSYTGFP